MNTAVMFSKQSDEWRTPLDFFDELHREFVFTLDAAATSENKMTYWHYGPGSLLDRVDGLEGDWHRTDRIWCNPPYSRVGEFVRKAAFGDGLVVMLLPARTDTKWWHDYVWDRINHCPRPRVQVRFIKGRLKFGGSANSAPFPSVVVIFRPPS